MLAIDALIYFNKDLLDKSRYVFENISEILSNSVWCMQNLTLYEK